jgi:hypothetical protein
MDHLTSAPNYKLIKIMATKKQGHYRAKVLKKFYVFNWGPDY